MQIAHIQTNNNNNVSISSASVVLRHFLPHVCDSAPQSIHTYACVHVCLSLFVSVLVFAIKCKIKTHLHECACRCI